VADLKYMKVPYIQEGVKAGRIIDCGDGMSPVIEKIIDADADAILLSPFENSGGYGKLEDIDIPLIECAEYMEQSPLARAEWIRFYGMLYGHEREADSLFAIVDSSYHALKEMVKTSTTMRSVLMDKQTGSVWYVPGGQSTIGQMLSDARCVYPFASDKRSGSLAMPFESMLEKCGDADVWIFNNYGAEPTYESLAAEYHGYRIIKAYKEHRVWYVNSMAVPYFEEVSFRPDRLLRDYIIMLHPGLLQGRTRYYRELGVRS
jgi:iron complex transport system substrate-binding protein